MENDHSPIRHRIGRAMFTIAAALITVGLCIAAFQACENNRVTGEPIVNIQIG